MAEILRVGRLSLVYSKVEDAEDLCNRLRFFDKRECYIWGVTPLEALTEPFADDGSITYTIKFDDEIIAMCGTVPIDDSKARVWMLGTQSINNNYRPFLKGCKKVIELLQSDYLELENYIPSDHQDTIMWLTWCGFSFPENESYEICGHSMLRFVRCQKRKNNVYPLIRPVMH